MSRYLKTTCFSLLMDGNTKALPTPPIQKAEGAGLVLTKTEPTDVLWKVSLNLFDSYLGCDP